MIRQPFKRRCAVCNRVNGLCGIGGKPVLCAGLCSRWNPCCLPIQVNRF